ncbi:FAD binding domain-containing protein [Kribbella sp. VKM Ac-2527]|uniref:FAD binding domain-containing protein n=1 Tax=Kribbella caucasensis TaxID=2512215 RepID=A0A4R6J2U3_9ACTN|nr:FAD-dependent monooxygenase [Kribbella sp. VKM Ac-2527]TDO29619.1 FAD binding domain-containing protein [Kribbella sp. VKM Ac-2527]
MTKVLISGAGIAGPAVAYWLRRYGLEPTVVEVAPGPRPGGQTIDIRGVARDVVDRMGLMPAIRDVQMHEKGLEYVRANRRRAVAMPAELLDGAGPVAEIEILRGDLSSILLDATTDVEYLYGDSITGLMQDDHGVRVTFREADERRFDLVIGADGVHSRTRSIAFGPESQYVHHLGGYASYFTIEAPEPLDGWMKIYTAPGGRWLGLRPRNEDHAQAFAAYQRVMQGYVEQRMELPPGGIEMAMPNSAAAIWARNTSTRLMTSRPFRGVLAKLAAAQPDAIDLPDYLTPSRG